MRPGLFLAGQHLSQTQPATSSPPYRQALHSILAFNVPFLSSCSPRQPLPRAHSGRAERAEADCRGKRAGQAGDGRFADLPTPTTRPWPITPSFSRATQQGSVARCSFLLRLRSPRPLTTSGNKRTDSAPSAFSQAPRSPIQAPLVASSPRHFISPCAGRVAALYIVRRHGEPAAHATVGL